MDYLQHLTKTVHRTSYPAISPTNPANSAAGKTIVISGGAQGIGYAIARGFSAAGAATVVLLARRQEALDAASARLRAENAAAKRHTDVWTYLLDIRDAAAAGAVFAAIRTRLNATASTAAEPRDADVLVTSAARLDQGDGLLDFDPQTVRDSFETNVLGNLNLVRAFLAPEVPAIPIPNAFVGRTKDMSGAPVPVREKVVLDVSSAAGYLHIPGQAIYGPSKLAFTRMMAHLQTEVDQLEGKPVRIHSFNPGTIYTPGAKAIGLEGVELPWDDESLPEGFAVWLASPAAAFLKGRLVLSCWDVEELLALKKRFEEDPNLCTVAYQL
ncbi:Short-chain dehydrogenase/reductase SDR [Neofusicoccum parvum]|nr:Short-chain dehydrogenase/reductase SDR [Neofusicoccum parvum]